MKGISEWKQYRMDEIYTERKEPGSDELPILSVSIHSGVSDGELDEAELGKKVRRIEDRSQYRKAVAGDLVFNMMRAWQGAIGVVKTTGQVSPAYIVAQPNDKVYPPFMDYYMNTSRMIGMIDRQSYGVTDFRKRLYWDSFSSITCFLPSLEEQERITRILHIQDTIIELKDRKVAEKKILKQYYLQQLIEGTLRFQGCNSQWKKVKLGNICHYSSTHGKSKGMEYVSTENMLSNFGGVTFSTTDCAEYDGVCYKKGDILIGNIRPYLRKVWLADREGCCSTDVLVVRAKECVPEYLYNLIARDDFFDTVSIGAKGTKMPRGDKNYIMKIDVPFTPDREEQHKIADFFANIDHELFLLQQEIALEKNKKKALLNILLQGIVRCTD